MELHSPLSRLVIFGLFGVPRFVVIAVERRADLAALGRFEFLLVKSDRSRMGHNKGLSNDPGLSGRVAYQAGLVCAAPPRSINANSIALKVR